MRDTVVRLQDVPPRRWANGGGDTRELLRWPGDDWRVRVSVAEIAHDGPFSVYDATTRWFAVLSGAGVELRWPQAARVLRPGDAPIRFDGADAPACRLVDGPTRDLNLMLRGGGRSQGALTAARAGDRAPAGDALGFYDRDAGVLHWPFTDARAPADGFWIVAR